MAPGSKMWGPYLMVEVVVADEGEDGDPQGGANVSTADSMATLPPDVIIISNNFSPI